MANLENNNSENKKQLSEKVEEKVQEALENLKNTIEHPVETAKQAAKEVKQLSWWAKLFLWTAGVITFLFLAILVAINIPATKDRTAKNNLGKLEEDF